MSASSSDERPSDPRSVEDKLASLSVREGDVVLGKYRLAALLAASATGAVFLAHHLELKHEVAVKLLLDPFSQDREVRARFAREGKLLSRIESDHVVRIIDVGELDDGTPVMIMESLRGRDLRHALRDYPRGMNVTRAVDFILQACAGLAAVHSRGIVHRDLKPSNLFVTERPDGTESLKILDFGIAKAHAGSASVSDALTTPGGVVGSPRYMAPEQITAAQNVDARADVWSLAVILQELLTGKPVFGMTGVANVLRAIVSTPAPSLLASLPSASPDLASALARALDRERNARTPDVAAFARALAFHASLEARMLVPRIERMIGGDASSTPRPLPNPQTRIATMPAPPDPSDDEPTRFREGGIAPPPTPLKVLDTFMPRRKPSRAPWLTLAIVSGVVTIVLVILTWLISR